MKGSTKSVLSLGAIGGGVGVPCLAYDQLVLKKIRNERKEFEKTFNNKKDSVDSGGIEGISKDTDPKIAAEEIREGCQNKLERPLDNKNIGSSFISACESKLSTVRTLLENEMPFIEEDEDYEVSLFFLKNVKDEDKKKIQTRDEEVSNERLKVGCNEQLNKKITEAEESLLRLINDACKIHPLNTAEKVLKFKYPGGTITSDWEGTFEKGKDTATLITLLNKNNSEDNITSSTDKSKGGNRLKNGCIEEKDKKVSRETNNDFLDHILFVCSGNNPPIAKNFPIIENEQ